MLVFSLLFPRNAILTRGNRRMRMPRSSWRTLCKSCRNQSGFGCEPSNWKESKRRRSEFYGRVSSSAVLSVASLTDVRCRSPRIHPSIDQIMERNGQARRKSRGRPNPPLSSRRSHSSFSRALARSRTTRNANRRRISSQQSSKNDSYLARNLDRRRSIVGTARETGRDD